ncbi:hypothetical protein GQ43DRAFT_392898 [Delitschia confertaspora ATCC 74209]|uniref:Uncharacterized protein n=1 Tax=Delitschia confertaspora ATCC 74209 TaxID=1513339 RepID=A0A9P4MZP1_9PLEO|nr:hypothetical protein GQ43DRAFT_392898 [Delitschia confertaspora ATCC 74209]
MRFSSSLLLALSVTVFAEEQIPLANKVKGWWNKVASTVPSTPSAPVAATAAKVASSVQHELTPENWKTVLTRDPTASAPTTQEWMVFITGANATCYGFCENASQAWNESVAVLSAAPRSPKFAVLDCEKYPVLCNSWSVGPPTIYYMSIPKPLADQSAPAPTVRYIPLSRNATVTAVASNITRLVANKEYENYEPYEGYWHPFNGLLAQYGLAMPIGYVLWGFSKMPSWLPMILISLMSRGFMNRRMPQGNAPAAPAAPAAR